MTSAYCKSIPLNWTPMVVVTGNLGGAEAAGDAGAVSWAKHIKGVAMSIKKIADKRTS